MIVTDFPEKAAQEKNNSQRLKKLLYAGSFPYHSINNFRSFFVPPVNRGGDGFADLFYNFTGDFFIFYLRGLDWFDSGSHFTTSVLNISNIFIFFNKFVVRFFRTNSPPVLYLLGRRGRPIRDRNSRWFRIRFLP